MRGVLSTRARRSSPVPSSRASTGVRTVGRFVTASLANDASENGVIPLAESFQVLAVTLSAAAWVRLYQTVADRTADEARAITADPAPGAGVICDVYLTSGTSLRLAPTPFGFDGAASPTGDIPIRVTNKSGGAAAITVDIETLEVE